MSLVFHARSEIELLPPGNRAQTRLTHRSDDAVRTPPLGRRNFLALCGRGWRNIGPVLLLDPHANPLVLVVVELVAFVVPDPELLLRAAVGVVSKKERVNEFAVLQIAIRK